MVRDPDARLSGLDNKCRMNTPSTVGTNWKWRIRKNQLSVKLQKEIHAVTLRYGRMNWTEDVEEAAEAENKYVVLSRK